MKMDRKLISKEPWEPRYFAKRHGLTMQEARTIIALHGPSREKCDTAARVFLDSLNPNKSV